MPQLTTPTSRTSTESKPSHVGGPPMVNSDGKAMFKTTPTTRNGSVTSPIRSPLPKSALMFTAAPSHSNLSVHLRPAPESNVPQQADNDPAQWDPVNDDRPGLNFVGLRSVRGAPEPRFNPTKLDPSSHPNERGHRLCCHFPVLAYGQPSCCMPESRPSYGRRIESDRDRPLIYNSEVVVDRLAISALLRASQARTGAEPRHHCRTRCRMGGRRRYPRL
jgi:hypothetical protein